MYSKEPKRFLFCLFFLFITLKKKMEKERGRKSMVVGEIKKFRSLLSTQTRRNEKKGQKEKEEMVVIIGKYKLCLYFRKLDEPLWSKTLQHKCILCMLEMCSLQCKFKFRFIV